MQNVRDIMTRSVLTIARGTPVGKVARTLTENEASGAPVCDADGRVIGFISKTDLVEAFATGEDEHGQRVVDDVMYPEVLSVAPDEPVDEAIRTMAFEGVHHVVVLDESGALVGLVTSMDVLRALAHIPREEDRVIAVAPPP